MAEATQGLPETAEDLNNSGEMDRGDDRQEICIRGNLLEQLQCFFCTNMLQPPISVCSNGHSCCGDCRNNMMYCGFCKGPFATTRNFALENLLTSCSVWCKFRRNGCEEFIPLKDYVVHTSMCQHSPINLNDGSDESDTDGPVEAPWSYPSWMRSPGTRLSHQGRGPEGDSNATGGADTNTVDVRISLSIDDPTKMISVGSTSSGSVLRRQDLRHAFPSNSRVVTVADPVSGPTERAPGYGDNDSSISSQTFGGSLGTGLASYTYPWSPYRRVPFPNRWAGAFVRGSMPYPTRRISQFPVDSPWIRRSVGLSPPFLDTMQRERCRHQQQFSNGSSRRLEDSHRQQFPGERNPFGPNPQSDAGPTRFYLGGMRPLASPGDRGIFHVEATMPNRRHSVAISSSEDVLDFVSSLPNETSEGSFEDSGPLAGFII